MYTVQTWVDKEKKKKVTAVISLDEFWMCLSSAGLLRVGIKAIIVDIEYRFLYVYFASSTTVDVHK